MRALCDTSVFVAGMSHNHPHYDPSSQFLAAIKNKKAKGFAAMHSLSECYSVMTSLRLDYLPRSVLEVIRSNIRVSFGLVALNEEDYWSALDRVSSKNLRSGSVYDALIFEAALKCGATHLITWNYKHFVRLSNGELQVATPEMALE